MSLRIHNNRCKLTEVPTCFTRGRPAQHDQRPNMNQMFVDERLRMKGGGVEDITRNAFKAAKFVIENREPIVNFLSKADDIVFGDFGTNISNALSKEFSKNPESRPKFAGERHMIIGTPHGPTVGNFIGPGTRLDTRLARGDRGVDGPDGLDAAAMKHDIGYRDARSMKDIRRADNVFIEDVRTSTGSRGMKGLVIGAIKAKSIGERVGIISPSTFSAFPGQGRRGRRLPSGKKFPKRKDLLRTAISKKAERNLEKIMEDNDANILPADRLLKVLSRRKR